MAMFTAFNFPLAYSSPSPTFDSRHEDSSSLSSYDSYSPELLSLDVAHSESEVHHGFTRHSLDHCSSSGQFAPQGSWEIDPIYEMHDTGYSGFSLPNCVDPVFMAYEVSEPCLSSEAISPQFSELSISDFSGTIGTLSSCTQEITCSTDPVPTSHLVKEEAKSKGYEGDEDDRKPSPALTSTRRRSYRRRRSAAQPTATRAPRFTPTTPYRSLRPASSTTRLHPSAITTYSTSQPIDSRSTHTKPRSKQVSGVPNYNAKNAHGDFCCDICSKVFKPEKRIDWRRHVRTHYRDTEVGEQYCCCGIPVDQIFLPEHAESTTLTAQVETYNGRLMIGGCGKYFSRRDALRRHLTQTSKRCVGDINGDWHPQKWCSQS